MNKNEIKEIIIEEIKDVLKEMASPEQLAADSRPEEDDITPPGIEDMSPDPMFGPNPSFVEEEELSEMPRTSNIFKLNQDKFELHQEASIKDVLQFMQRVNNVLKTYKSPGQKRPKKRFTPEEMKALATVMLNPEGFNSKDVIAATSYNSPAQANKFLKALEMKDLITLTSQLKKAMEPTSDPDAPETRGRKRRDAEFDMADDPTMMDFGDFEDLDLSDPLAEDAGFGGAANLELKNAAKQIYQHFGSFAQAKIIGRSANKSDVKHFTTKDINPAEPYAVIFMNGSDVDPGEHLFVQIGAPDPGARKDAVARIKSKFPKFEYKSSESQSGNIFIANLVIKPGKTTSENTNKMTNLEKYIKQQIRESKEEMLNETPYFGPDDLQFTLQLAQTLGMSVKAMNMAIAAASPVVLTGLIFLTMAAEEGSLMAKKKLTKLIQKLKRSGKGSGEAASTDASAEPVSENEGEEATPEEIEDVYNTLMKKVGNMSIAKATKMTDPIREAKNPLANKIKEIENQGRLAALETKLAAVAEMIEETEGRLTRIDEDTEFKEMMDRNAVKEVRKQLKELQKIEAKLGKEKAKLEGKGMKSYKKKEVMDEDLPVAEDAVENAVDEIELEEDDFKLSESVKRMQKLANLRG